MHYNNSRAACWASCRMTRCLVNIVQVPAGLEEAVCSLSRGERAVFSCPAASLRSSPDSMWVLPPDLQYIELDVILLAMIEASLIFHLWICHHATHLEPQIFVHASHEPCPQTCRSQVGLALLNEASAQSDTTMICPFSSVLGACGHISARLDCSGLI